MATVLDIAKGLSQVVMNSRDGALDADGERVLAGLKREKGDMIKDSRVMDGFNIRLQDNKMILSYQCEIMSKDAHKNDFEGDVKSTVTELVKFIKKEYKKVTGNSISLKEKGKPDIFVERISNVRSTVHAVCVYEVGGLKSQNQEKKLDNAIKDWLKLGKGGEYEGVPK